MKVKAALAIVVALVGATALLWFDLAAVLERFSTVADKHPILAPILFVLAYIVTCVLLLPGAILTAAAGLLFGRVIGFLCVSCGATLGACLAFVIAKYLAKDAVLAYASRHPKFKALDAAVSRVGGRIVLFSRLCPLIPFRWSNYAFGATSIPFKTFALYTWLGTIPSAAVYVYLGSLASDLSELSERSRSWWEWLLLGAGAIMFLGLAYYISRLARRALEAELQHGDTGATHANLSGG